MNVYVSFIEGFIESDKPHTISLYEGTERIETALPFTIYTLYPLHWAKIIVN